MKTSFHDKIDFLNLLSEKFPTVNAASTEIINLQAILNLPKGTEHFLSDLHGEFESFQHVIRNASGVIKDKINLLFDKQLTKKDMEDLAFLIYYPKERLQNEMDDINKTEEWYKITLFRLLKLCRQVASKYTRSKVRKALPKDFGYIIEELLHEQNENKQEYYDQIINTIISLERADSFIIQISKLIQRLAIDHLHVIGDIFDRGPGAHLIMDLLIDYHSVDIQWGNHDILWMGAAAGSEACIANVLRIAFRYGELDTIEDGYGINLRPLWGFALKAYKEDPCIGFCPKTDEEDGIQLEKLNLAKLQKAIAIIQFKLEGQIIQNRPNFEMNDRLLLDKIDYENQTICINNKIYQLITSVFPTIKPQNPYELTSEEAFIVKQLKLSFLRSEKLQKHVRFLYSKGSLYKIHNKNLLYHGCILLNDDKSLKTLTIQNKQYKGKELMDQFDLIARQGYFSNDYQTRKYGLDIMWYLWSGADSPLFGKQKMATFERYFIKDKKLHVEEKNPYYHFRNEEEVCKMILNEFGLNPKYSHIINGHVPVKTSKGESPVKANSRLIVIDGGMSKAYQPVTGIAGYTLIHNSHGLNLVAHHSFVSKRDAIEKMIDIDSQSSILESVKNRIRVKDTDTGLKLQKQISDLSSLLTAYRKGLIKERID